MIVFQHHKLEFMIFQVVKQISAIILLRAHVFKYIINI